MPSLDTIAAMAKALYILVHVLPYLEREEDKRNSGKRIDVLLDGCRRRQLELVHRVTKAILEP